MKSSCLAEALRFNIKHQERCNRPCCHASGRPDSNFV